MVPSKLLIGSVVGVGSVSTAAVVAHQHGLFSTTSQSQETSDTVDAGTTVPVSDTLEAPEAQDQDSAEHTDVVSEPKATDPERPPAPQKPNQDAIENWLKENKGSESWKIQIKKGQETKDFKDPVIEEEDLKELLGYLNSSENKELLKSLFSALDEKTLTFDKSSGNWKHILTTTDVEKWVSKISKGKATLKLSEGNAPKQLTDTQIDLNKLLKDLFDGKSLFEKTASQKNILFEKIDNIWKHTKTEIEGWLKTEVGEDNKFEIKVKKGSDTEKTLDEADEENLIGLFNYLKENKDTLLLKLIKNKTPAHLTFKKENGGWEVIHNETTVKNWVSNVAGAQTTLKFYDGSQEKTPENDKWKTLLGLIKGETELFKNSAEKRTIIFEKDGTSWKHIKKAIESWLSSTNGADNKLKIQIQKESSKKLDWNNSEVQDEDLIGLLKHLKDKKSTYIQKGVSTPVSITLQKTTKPEGWEQVTGAAGA